MIKREWITLEYITPSNNTTKIVSELTRSGKAIRNLRKTDSGVIFTCRRGDHSKMEEIAATFEAELRLAKNHGLTAVAKSIRLRAGLMIGVLIGVVIVIVLSNFVLGVDIKCDQEQFYGEIEQTLRKSGVIIGMPLSKVDIKSVEQELLRAIEESVFATVSIRGVVVYVEVVTVPLTEGYSGGKDRLMARYDGIVTRVIVNSGTGAVKENDRVAVGDTLIDGYININKDPYQEEGQETKVAVNAEGEVYAKVYYHKRIYAEANTIATRRTGNKKIARHLYLGKIPIGKSPKIEYTNYESITTYSQINVLAPINVVTVTYYEIEDYVIDSATYIEMSIMQSRQAIIEELEQGAKILTESIIPSAQNAKIVDFYMEVEQRIDNGGHYYSYG